MHSEEELIYTCGLGHYAEKGFGMLDVVTADREKKTTPYEIRTLH